MGATEIAAVLSAPDLDEIRALFTEYAASLEFSLEFQGFPRELAELPGRYEPPSGCILIARRGGVAAGCVAYRAIAEDICEMKRLYVRPAFHGQGVGRRLAVALIDRARLAGYAAMRLDTVPSMHAAIALYASLGFSAIDPYVENPIAGARFLELRLA